MVRLKIDISRYSKLISESNQTQGQGPSGSRPAQSTSGGPSPKGSWENYTVPPLPTIPSWQGCTPCGDEWVSPAHKKKPYIPKLTQHQRRVKRAFWRAMSGAYAQIYNKKDLRRIDLTTKVGTATQEQISKCIDVLNKRIRRKIPYYAYNKHYEIGESHGMLHAHILCAFQWLPWEWLKEQWTEITSKYTTGTSWGVYIKSLSRVTDKVLKQRVFYAVGYCTMDPSYRS